MEKLRNLGPSLTPLAPRLSYTKIPEAKNQASLPPLAWHQWKWSRRWKALRQEVLKRDQYRCQWPGCGRIHHDTSKLVADHRIPHRGDERLFWDIANLQTLCADPCHNKHKQRMEVQMPKGVWT